MLIFKERNLCQLGGKEMVPGSIFGAAPDEDTSQQEICAFSFCPPFKRIFSQLVRKGNSFFC